MTTPTNKTKLVPFTTQSGNTYHFPEQYGEGSVSARIKSMTKDGYTPYAISKVSGIRYQMIRNILVASGLWDSRPRKS